jgi:DNA-binding transcriptional MerR regulator
MLLIGEVARRVGRSPSWIRKVEAAHGIKPGRVEDGRTGGSIRVYSVEDVEILMRIRDSRNVIVA